MTPSDRVLQLIVARFLCQRDSELTWVISPYAAKWAQGRGVEVSSALLIAPSDEWKSYRDLSRNQELIHSRHEYFSGCMTELVAQLPREVDRFTAVLRPDEYRVLLVYAGTEVYDFFARDHRFGPPPRGKPYRSNLRAPMNGGKRPDNAVTALQRKVDRVRSAGADTTVLERELDRRREALERGEDPLDGRERVVVTPDEAAERLRDVILGPRPDPLDGVLLPHEVDRIRAERERESGEGTEQVQDAHELMNQYRERHPEISDAWERSQPGGRPGGGEPGQAFYSICSAHRERDPGCENCQVGSWGPAEGFVGGGHTGRWVDPRAVAALATVPVEVIEVDE